MEGRSSPSTRSPRPPTRQTPRKRDRRDCAADSETLSAASSSLCSSASSGRTGRIRSSPAGEHLSKTGDSAGTRDRRRRQNAENRDQLNRFQAELFAPDPHVQEKVRESTGAAHTRQHRSDLSEEFQSAVAYYENEICKLRLDMRDPRARVPLLRRKLMCLSRSREKSGDSVDLMTEEGF